MPLITALVRLTTALCLFISVASVALAAESDRYALVIGNSQYALASLKNPVNDATDMSAQLKALGYHIHKGKPLLDLDRASFEHAILDFAISIPAGSTAIVYYAGHGVSVDGENYLLPVGDQMTTPAQLKDRSISLKYALAELEDHNPDGMNIFLVDACRDNPLGQSFTRSLPNGLSKIGGADGSFVGYAAGTGQVAIDGQGRNGIYTGELLHALANESHLTIEEMHKRVKARVQQKTSGTQSPMYEANFTGTFCFGVCNTTVSRAPPAPDSITSIPPPDPVNTTTSPAALSASSKRKWLYIGLGVLAAGVLAAAASSDGSSDGNSTGTVTATLNLPVPE